MKNYVLGFAFDLKQEQVVLIRKNKPEWQAGKLNGVGGKVEEADISVQHAMTREFFEETGVLVPPTSWHKYCVMGSGRVWECTVFVTITDDVFQCKTMETEEVSLFLWKGLNNWDGVISNLRWLVPAALDSLIGDRIIMEVNYP